MVVDIEAGTVEHRSFSELPEILGPGHFLVRNTTRVFPARLWGRRPGREERIEILLVREQAQGEWLALLRPARKAPAGQILAIGSLEARVLEVRPEGSRIGVGTSPLRRMWAFLSAPSFGMALKSAWV